MEPRPESPPAPATTRSGPARLSEVLERIDAKMPRAEALAAERAEEDRQAEAAKLAATIAERRNRLWEARGRRYVPCTLENFVVSCPDQESIVRRLQGYRGTLAEKVAAGVGIVLTGPSGTGKDHLLAGLFNAALAVGKTIKWTSGPKLFIRFRDQIGKDIDEARTIRDYTDPDILVLSDPMPLRGVLGDYQAQILYEILETRANAVKPNWVTINAANREDAERSLGSQIVRRLCDGALSLACNWPRYQEAAQ